MNKNCSYFATLITALVDNELDNDKKREVREHLQDCPECAKAYRHEETVKSLLRERLPKYHAPITLRSRIRRQLARYGERPSFWEILQSLFIYRPVPAMIAAAAILLFVLVPPIALNNWSGHFQDSGVVHAAQLEGQIICLDCEFETLNGQKIPHSHKVIEKPGLKTSDGKIYTFMQNSVIKTPFTNPVYLNKSAEIEGTLFENAHYIQVSDFHLE